MRTAIVYATHFGYSEEAARTLKRAIKGTVELIPFDYRHTPEIDSFDTVVLGGSIRMGLVDQEFRRWMSANEDVLLTKRLAIYVACAYPVDLPRYYTNNFPSTFLEHSEATVCIGGRLSGQMKWYDRQLVKMMRKQLAKSGEELSGEHPEELQTIAAALNHATPAGETPHSAEQNAPE